jgi:hypothetical protein
MHDAFLKVWERWERVRAMERYEHRKGWGCPLRIGGAR